MRNLLKILISFLLAIAMMKAQAQGINVIVNSRVEIREMTIQELQEIFTLKRGYWSNGLRVKVFVMSSDSILTRRFISEVLQLSPSMYFDLIQSAYAMGKSNIPTAVPRPETVVIKVMTTMGGIGYTDISESRIDSSNVTVIKVLP